MNAIYRYVVLRLAVDRVRGEIINVGVALFHEGEAARVITMAPLNKLRAIDATWSSDRLAGWVGNVETILASQKAIEQQVLALARFGFCDAGAVGMFTAETHDALIKELSGIKALYVSSRTKLETRSRASKRTRLQTAIRDQFKSMHVLGAEIGDLANHLVVPNVPVPGHDELKTDFVYKNGVYRLTQTLDYNVAPDSLHNKLTEACVKSTAADMAARAYGDDTMRFAVVDIPDEFADAADAHIDLLQARGFEIFHFSDPASMADYIAKAAPLAGIDQEARLPPAH